MHSNQNILFMLKYPVWYLGIKYLASCFICNPKKFPRSVGWGSGIQWLHLRSEKATSTEPTCVLRYDTKPVDGEVQMREMKGM